MRCCFLLSVLLLIPRWAAAVDGSPAGQWSFTARLDGRPIGTHTFQVAKSESGTVVESRASFDVSLLGFSLYSYEHQAHELWSGGCLARLDSQTDDNGSPQKIRGEQTGEVFVLERGVERRALAPCTMTFAYWNPRFREQSRLLNPQTGDHLDVSIRFAGRDNTVVGGRSVEANRYEITGNDLEITLWYSVDADRWLALDSRLSSGRRLSYRME